jgi:uncharacterized protein DUF998
VPWGSRQFTWQTDGVSYDIEPPALLPDMTNMKLSRRSVVACMFLVCWLQGHRANARGPSTPEERAKVIELTRMLERDPLNENADATRQWLREWTIEVPEIRFHVCDELLSHGLGENYPYSREINLQTILSGAVFTLERQDKARDDVGAYLAGVEGSLRMYGVLAKARPDARSPFLDGLVAMRDRGELADHVAKLAAEKCPKSNMLLIAAPIGAAVGLILGSLVGWLFGERSHRLPAPDVASAPEKHSAPFASAAQSIVFACAGYYVIVGAALHFLEPEYDPRYRFMSEYAWSAHGWLMTTTFFVLALALLTVALALRNLYLLSRSARVGFGVLVVGAAGICVAGVFREFPLHDVGSAVGLPSVVMATLLLSWSFRRAPGWRPLFLITLLIALGMFTTLFSMVIDVGMPGLQQRIFLGLVLLWLAIVAHGLVRVTARPV